MSNKQPSSKRIRNERGREDKPLSPVLYSMREGGELYGAIFSDKRTIQHQHGVLAKKTLKGEAKSYYRQFARRAAREVPFSEMSESELNQLFTLDDGSVLQGSYGRHAQYKVVGE